MPERQSIEQVEYRHVTLADLETRTQANEDGTFSGYANLHEVTDSYGTRFAKGSWNAGGLGHDQARLPVDALSRQSDRHLQRP